ncbi:MAG: tripartite tricarboxylate transporter substrate binding protein [Rhizobiales bacterium]|nr:tripartite tricarboxylate transporter substrate binding protein [Hyphomicrobiales bacterium]
MTKWMSALASIGCLLVTTGAPAQAYPTKTVTMIVTAAAGGVTDVVARAIAQRLSEKWGQQVVVENKGGAGHILGAMMIAKAAPDGHTIMVAERGTFVINPHMYSADKLPYKESDLAPVTGLVRIHHALIVKKDLPTNSLADVVKLAKEKPGKLTYGTAGNGSGPHVNMAMLENAAGIKMVAAHYRGATPAFNDLVGGHIDMMLISLTSALGAVEDGKVKMLAVGSAQRLPEHPNLPTTRESVPGYDAGTWFGMATTTGTPKDIIMKINKDVRDIINEPEVNERFVKKQLYTPMLSSPDEFAAALKAETVQWGKIIKEQNLEIKQK